METNAAHVGVGVGWRVGVLVGVLDTHEHTDTHAHTPFPSLLTRMMESNAVSTAVVALLVLDIVRFFIDLLILEELFGDAPWVSELEDVLHWASISILSLFCVEILLLIVALGR